MQTRAMKPILHLHDDSSGPSEHWYLRVFGSPQFQTLKANASLWKN